MQTSEAFAPTSAKPDLTIDIEDSDSDTVYEGDIVDCKEVDEAMIDAVCGDRPANVIVGEDTTADDKDNIRTRWLLATVLYEAKYIAMPKSRRDQLLEFLRQFTATDYFIGQMEICPTTERLHSHFLIRFKSSTRWNTFRKGIKALEGVMVCWLSKVTTSADSLNRLKAYVSKENTRCLETFVHGTWTTGQGQRTDAEELKQMLQDGKTELEIATAFPTQYMRYTSGIKQMRQLFIQERNRIEQLEKESLSGLLPWQEELEQLLEQPVDDRAIIWIYDPAGSSGKSKFAKKMALKKDTVLLEPFKTSDMRHLLKQAYSDNEIKTVIINVPRSYDATYLAGCYKLAESLKDGFVMSGKYEGCNLTVAAPHVVFLSNEEPDQTKWSSDRLVPLCLCKYDKEDKYPSTWIYGDWRSTPPAPPRAADGATTATGESGSWTKVPYNRIEAGTLVRGAYTKEERSQLRIMPCNYRVSCY